MSYKDNLSGPELPPTLDAEGLGKLLFLSAATIQADLSRKPDRLPNGIRKGKRTFWLTETVLQWLKEQERPLAETRATRTRKVTSPSGAIGRPRKAEIIEAQRLGISVPELRRRTSSTKATPAMTSGIGGAT